MSRRKAPKQQVIEIWRTGSYGKVEWHHRLACGHVETRKRAADTTHIGCETCFAHEEARTKPRPIDTNFYSPSEPAGLARPRLIADIAAHFGVQQEMVEVGFNQDEELSFASVMFDRSALRRLGFLR